MNRYGLALAAILAASPVSAANVTTWADATGWANLAVGHKCADRYGVLARNLRVCHAGVGSEGAHTPVISPHANFPPKLQRLRTASFALHAEE